MEHNVAQKTDSATEDAQNIFVRGDTVTARDYKGRELRRRVWGVGDTVVYLCSERLYASLTSGTAIGFPKRDVWLTK